MELDAIKRELEQHIERLDEAVKVAEQAARKLVNDRARVKKALDALTERPKPKSKASGGAMRISDETYDNIIAVLPADAEFVTKDVERLSGKSNATVTKAMQLARDRHAVRLVRKDGFAFVYRKVTP